MSSTKVDAARAPTQAPDGDAALVERGGAGATAGEAYYLDGALFCCHVCSAVQPGEGLALADGRLRRGFRRSHSLAAINDSNLLSSVSRKKAIAAFADAAVLPRLLVSLWPLAAFR